jgi:hypothetical protein
VPVEHWRQIPTLPVGYQASDLGRVRSWRRPGRAKQRFRPWPVLRKPVPNCRTGYLTMMFVVAGKYVNRYVHHLVLEAFVGFRTSPEVRHLNGDYTDNRLMNICWGTHKENVEDQRRHGTLTRGHRNGMAKLSPTQVAAIRSSRLRLRALADCYHVSQATVSRVRNGVRYVD